MPTVKTHLMFQGDAEAAIALYQSVFADFQLGEIERYGEEDQLPAGSFKRAPVHFAGHEMIILDSPPMHDFSFTPSISLFVDLEDRPAFDAAFAALSAEGKVMMLPDNYGFEGSTHFTWVEDRFGVSWQLNLP